jgi:hypothetical protein
MNRIDKIVAALARAEVLVIAIDMNLKIADVDRKMPVEVFHVTDYFGSE